MPRLAPDCVPTRLALTPSEGFLLSRIDGQTPWAVLREIGGLPPEQVDACLERWHADGILVSGADAASATGGANGKPEDPEDCIDPGLDLDVETQRRILDLEAKLDAPYHQILGVAPDASVKSLKRAYFTLSKEYHPDRYFRRNIGPFAQRLDRVFKKILEAYELLSDPATRTEVERSMDHAETPPKAAASAPSSAVADPAAQARKRELLERIRKRFRIPREVLSERKIKAGQFARAGERAAQQGRWSEAAASIRLAIAFDPWNAEYKAPFAEIQAKALQHRAACLIEEAEGARDGEGGKNALRLYEEALHCQPYDPEINYNAASAALAMGDPKLAQEYAERVCELCPDDARYRMVLGEVCKEIGRLDEAIEHYEKATALDPEDTKAKKGLEAVRRESRRRRQLGGK